MKSNAEIKIQKFPLLPQMDTVTDELNNFKNSTENSKLKTINADKNIKTMKINPGINTLYIAIFFPAQNMSGFLSANIHSILSQTQTVYFS